MINNAIKLKSKQNICMVKKKSRSGFIYWTQGLKCHPDAFSSSINFISAPLGPDVTGKLEVRLRATPRQHLTAIDKRDLKINISLKFTKFPGILTQFACHHCILDTTITCGLGGDTAMVQPILSQPGVQACT